MESKKERVRATSAKIACARVKLQKTRSKVAVAATVDHRTPGGGRAPIHYRYGFEHLRYSYGVNWNGNAAGSAKSRFGLRPVFMNARHVSTFLLTLLKSLS